MSRRPRSIIDRVLIAAGILLLAAYAASLLHARLFQTYDSWAFDRALAARAKPPADASTRAGDVVSEDAPDLSEWSSKRIQDYRESRRRGEVRPLGRLEIPSLGLRVMVLEGTDDWTLNRAVGWIEGTARPGEAGNIGIAGHRDGFFRPLRNLHVGEEIRLTTLAGTYRYKVQAIQIVSQEALQVLGPTPKPTLTLVTCYPFYYVGSAPKRYIVKAEQEAPHDPLPSTPGRPPATGPDLARSSPSPSPRAESPR